MLPQIASPLIAIIGCGNANRRDDAVGVEVIRLLRETLREQDDRVRLLDTGTDGMGVLFAARGCGALIIVDACRSGGEAGAIHEVPGAELEQQLPRDMRSLNDFRWDHALYAGKRVFAADFPTDITVFLIEAEHVDLGVTLSPSIAAAAEKVAALIRERVRAKRAGQAVA